MKYSSLLTNRCVYGKIHSMRKINISALVLSVLALNSVGCSTVDEGNVGVEVSWRGPTVGNVLQPGLYWTFLNGVNEFTTRTQTYTMTGASQRVAGNTNANSDTEGSIRALTKDNLSITLDCSVTFHLNGANAVDVFRKVGNNYTNIIVHPTVRASIRDSVSELTMQQVVDNRATLQQRMQTLVEERMQHTLRSQHVPITSIVIDAILLRDVDLPDSIDEAIANVQRARLMTAQRTQELETARQEAATALQRAQGEANANLARVDGQAQATLRMATANAQANRTVASSLTSELLQLNRQEVMRALLNSNGTRTIIVPAGTTPTLMMPAQ